ncbi:cytochrome P450 [Halosolutus gelatinilyticus]|uniref:cytochrome P450 n=1 Tax=Halosolutus gelatinilyticus TaxID=2931975 RepID=UPI001FF31264|nr:cytochrome P450 [Halosolutus gelatinilyticus]
MSSHSRPPGPRGVPIAGSLPRYAADPFRFVTELRDAYGDVAAFDLGPNRTYLFTAPTAVERVLVTEESAFSKPRFQTDALGDLLGEGLLLSEGETWRERRDIAGPAFAPDRISNLAPMMARRSVEMVDRWNDGDERDVEWEMTRTTLEIIVESMFGIDLDPGRSRQIRRLLEPIGRRFEPDPRRLVVPEWVPTPTQREFDRSIAELERIVDVFVDRRRRRGIDPDDRDLLALLLRAREAGAIDEEGIRDELLTMLLAGHDTTALVLTYAWALLSEHPDVERRIHAEVDALFDDRDDPRELTAIDVRQLATLRNVLRETMRLYPPVYALFRQVDRPVEVSGYRLPEAAFVLLSQWATHRDPRYFDDPETFDPDRWTDPRHPTYAYFPFGAGPRSCIGKGFTMLEAPIIAAIVAREFRLHRTQSDPIDLRGSLTAHPEGGMPMELVRRS